MNYPLAVPCWAAPLGAKGGLLALCQLVTVLVDLDLDHGDDVDLALIGGDDELVSRTLRLVVLARNILVARKLLALELLGHHQLLGLVGLWKSTTKNPSTRQDTM